MKLLKFSIFFGLIPFFILNCNRPPSSNDRSIKEKWRYKFNDELSLFGHRNWILVVDKAFPAQNADGITIINTGENLLDVLDITLQEVEHSTHVRPIVYTDKELNFIHQEQIKGIDSYRKSLDKTIEKYNPQVMLHDSVFFKIDEASKLFKVLILKTNEIIPYSSVFIELDCKYWSEENENLLRNKMAY